MKKKEKFLDDNFYPVPDGWNHRLFWNEATIEGGTEWRDFKGTDQ